MYIVNKTETQAGAMLTNEFLQISLEKEQQGLNWAW